MRHVDDDGEVSSTPVGGERGGGVGGGEGLPPLTEEQEAVVCAVRYVCLCLFVCDLFCVSWW